MKNAIKLCADWNAETNVFYDGIMLEGETHEGWTLPELVDTIRVGIDKVLVDCIRIPRERPVPSRGA